MKRQGTRRARRPGVWRSVRVRAALALGAVGLLATTGTFAFWTDDVPITGTTFSTGVLDLQVNNADSYATTTLGMTAMVPGNSSAQVLTLRNNGTVPLKYTLTGGLAGTDATTLAAAGALSLTITSGAISGSGSSATCTGTVVVGPTALTSVTSTAIIAARRGPIAVGLTDPLCFQISFDAAAASSLQGKTATATFTATGTSDVS